MKKTIYSFLLLLFTLIIFTTCKNPGIDYNTFSITSENIQAERNKVLVSGEYDFLGEVMSMKINIGLDEQLSDAESHSLNLENHGFSVTVDNLNPNTYYHYCYSIEFDQDHKILTDVNTFKTLPILDKPIVRTLEVLATDETTVFVKCVVDDSFGMDITERGVCWNDTGNPTYNNNHVVHPLNVLGEYTCVISNLNYNKNYFVCAYARNANGVGYGQVLGFHIEAPSSLLPSVTTAEVTNITETTAIGGGTVDDEGSTPVTERGICWSTGHNPDLNDFHAQDNHNGLGSYTIEMANLTQDETYYVRAYAINEQGIAFGEEVSFVVQNVYPIVTIEDVMEELTGNAVCRYSVDDEGSSPIIESGICCSTDHDPDITNPHTVVDYSGLGNYSAEMADLTLGGTYFFRAYAINRDGYIGYSSEMALEMKKIFSVSVSATPSIGGTVSDGGFYFDGEWCTVTAVPNAGYRFQYWIVDNNNIVLEPTYSFSVLSDVTLVAHFVNRPQPPVGTVDGCFTINHNGNKVWFSQGNLQYKASTEKWQFAAQQYDIIGNENSHIDQYYNGWIDLFGWATSGYHDPRDPDNVYYQPWANSQDFLGYGPSNAAGEFTGSAVNYDWGVYNQITTADGNSTGNMWRTLNKDEWNYVFNERHASTVNGVPDARFAKAYVNNLFGLILFPDDYTHPTGVGQPTGINGESNWNGYNYNTAEFELMQAAGVVFLPATGKRYGTAVNELNIGHYWSVTYNNITTAFELKFDQNSLLINTRNRCDGLSVRLVCPVQ